MTRTRATVTLAAALLATACAAPASPPAPNALFGGPVTVTGKLSLRSAGGYQLLDDGPPPSVEAWQADDVDHLKVFLRRGDGTEVDLGEHPDLGAPLTIANLRQDTTYTVRLEAYTADDARIDANADDPDGDTDAEGCETTFATTSVLTTELTGADAFKVKLVDQAFDGTVRGDVAITDGGVTGPDDDEALVPPPFLGDPLYDLVPVSGGHAVGDLFDYRAVTLPTGASQVYRTAADLDWFEPVTGAGTYVSRHHLQVAAWPPGGRLTIAAVSQAQAAAGAFPASGAIRLTRASTIFQATVEVSQDGAWVPHATLTTVPLSDDRPFTTELRSGLGGAGRTARLSLTGAGDRVPAIFIDDRDVSDQALNATGRVAVLYKFENMDAAARAFGIQPPAFDHGSPP